MTRAFDGGRAQRFVERGRLREGCQSGIVALTQGLEFLSSVGQSPLIADAPAERPELLNVAARNVKDSCFPGPHKPLVGTARVEVTAHVADIDGEASEGLRTVDNRLSALLARQPAQVSDWKLNTRQIGNLGHGQDPASVRS